MLSSVRKDWSNFDYLIFAIVWAAMVYFGATRIPCSSAADCGTFDMWFFGLISACLIPGAIFFTHFISIARPRKK